MSTTTKNITTISAGDWTIETTDSVLYSERVAAPLVYNQDFALISKSGARYFASSVDNAFALIAYYENFGK
jgi:hypothetical protein